MHGRLGQIDEQRINKRVVIHKFVPRWVIYRDINLVSVKGICMNIRIIRIDSSKSYFYVLICTD